MTEPEPTMSQPGGRVHWLYEYDGPVKVAACGWRSVAAVVGQGEFNCARCEHVLRATKKFFEKHGRNCRFRLGPPVQREKRLGSWSRLEVLPEE